MSLTLVLLLLGALLLLVICVNLIQQHKEQLELARQQQLAKHRATIDETEQLLTAGTLLPMSNELLLLLNQRILDAIDAALTIERNHSDYLRRKTDIEAQLISLNKNEGAAKGLDTFTVPTNDKQTLSLVQALKRLKDVLRHEHNKSRITHDLFVSESERADHLLARINATVLLDRARVAIQNSQLGSAKQLLSKLISNLNAQSSEDILFRDATMNKANAMLADIDQRQQASLHSGSSDKGSNELDELFQPKKKW
ncbi:hypothetical protein [Ferrimonas pelagia]|uniref:Flagellar motor control protein ZomB n=1 Tax=Ferrimonas pelagia TaxID=1177826 RepID=A0ABP9FGK7_9GAMM